MSNDDHDQTIKDQAAKPTSQPKTTSQPEHALSQSFDKVLDDPLNGNRLRGERLSGNDLSNDGLSPNSLSNHKVNLPQSQPLSESGVIPQSNGSAQASPTTQMAYEQRVSACQLDETLDSLKRLDLLLVQIRHELISEGVTESQFLSQQANRKFMLYLGQYSGQVLARQSNQRLKWLTSNELMALAQQLSVRSKDNAAPSVLTIDPNDFYHRLACVCRAQSQMDSVNLAADIHHLFLVLQPIGMRLFGSIDRRFYTIQGRMADDGLYQAVNRRVAQVVPTRTTLAHLTDQKDSVAAQANLAAQSETQSIMAAKSDSILTKTAASSDQALDLNQVRPALAATEAEDSSSPTLPISASSSSASPSALLPSTSASLSQATAPSNLESSALTRLPKKPSPPAFRDPDPLAVLSKEAIKDIKTTSYAQTAGQALYHKACKVLDIFEGYIHSQSRPRSEVQLSVKHERMREEAIVWLKESADSGNTAAMIRLALYTMLGEGRSQDIEAGVSLIQRAASIGDPRAQRLLSKLNYQGVGMAQDMKQGRYWLEEAAKNGHEESQKLLTEWQQADALTLVKQEDQKSDKRYLILIGAIIVLAVALIVFV